MNESVVVVFRRWILAPGRKYVSRLLSVLRLTKLTISHFPTTHRAGTLLPPTRHMSLHPAKYQTRLGQASSSSAI